MIDLDVARKDELPETFTSQDIEDIKAEIDIPRANVTILNTVYSPEETKVGVWREYRTVESQQVLMQKPVYQKTLTGTSTASSYAINISNLNIEDIHYLLGNIRDGSDGVHVWFGYYRNDADRLQVVVSEDNQSINLSSGTSYIHGKYEFTIQYTKTTDQWQEVVQ